MIHFVVVLRTATIIFDSSLNMYGPHARFDQCMRYESVRESNDTYIDTKNYLLETSTIMCEK